MGEAVAGGVAADALDEAAMAQTSVGFIYSGGGVAAGGVCVSTARRCGSIAAAAIRPRTPKR